MKFLTAFILSLYSFAWAQSVPKPVARAMAFVHKSAEESRVRNLFMFNYTYYSDGHCQDQDCSSERINKEKEIALSKMGNDFPKFKRFLGDYRRSIQALKSKLPKGDLATLSGSRGFKDVLSAGVFITCIDFAKVVLAKSIEYGFNPQNLRMYMLMQEEGYQKMCPTKGPRPILPRPVVHSLVAYKASGNWFALNVEDPEAVPTKLGPELPLRLTQNYTYTYPALIAYQKLTLAGIYSASDFKDGYPFSWLVSITASGELEVNSDLVRCN